MVLLETGGTRVLRPGLNGVDPQFVTPEKFLGEVDQSRLDREQAELCACKREVDDPPELVAKSLIALGVNAVVKLLRGRKDRGSSLRAPARTPSGTNPGRTT